MISAIDAIAPYPDSPTGVTAHGLAAHAAVSALAHRLQARRLERLAYREGDAGAEEAYHAALRDSAEAITTAHLLLALIEHAPAAADAAARRLWLLQHEEDHDAAAADLVRECGLDPETAARLLEG